MGLDVFSVWFRFVVLWWVCVVLVGLFKFGCYMFGQWGFVVLMVFLVPLLRVV